MARILGIDYGAKRVGIAVTDPLQIIATGLGTVETKDVFTFLRQYIQKEEVESIVVGDPKGLDNKPTHASPLVDEFVRELGKQFPALPVYMVDERYSSKRAVQSMIESGLSKKKRRNKALIDEVSANIILQDYLQSLEA